MINLICLLLGHDDEGTKVMRIKGKVTKNRVVVYTIPDRRLVTEWTCRRCKRVESL